MKLKFLLLLSLFSGLKTIAYGQTVSQTFYEVKVYHYDKAEQEVTIDAYLKEAFLPALGRLGIKDVGVFKPVGNDTLAAKRIFVLIPYQSPQQYADLPDMLSNDQRHNNEGKNYLEATFDKAPYKRIESTFIKAFTGMPKLQLPSLKNELSKRVYELRSYEGPTERMYGRKVEMFNKGGEIKLFTKLEFNAIFYGSVRSGSRMPNLMYMTAFEDMPSRDAHWKLFFASPKWKELSAMEYYKRTVSKSEIILLTPTSYSGI